jgi:G3E family GTPase
LNALQSSTVSAAATVKPPLVLLTGFLGAGKTTILNRVLGAQHSRRVGVIINELGRIDIDTRLIKSRAGDVMELAGGCVCHEVRVQSELWAAIAEVARRANPEVVVLETTGIAEPWSILDGLEGLGAAAPAVASGVVCAVDAEAGAGQIARHEEARAQIEAADRIVLTKLDLAAPDAVVALHRELARRNPAAERASFPPTDEATAEFCPWLLDVRSASRARPAQGSPHHHHHGQLAAIAYSDTAALLGEPLLAVVERLGPGLVRAKGFVHLAGQPRRGFLERAGLHTELRLGEPWGDERPATEIVLIGEGLDAGAIRRQIWACRAK